ncbi:UDP-N-acetylmuramoyl-L-alanine--D-glutamate ligase [Paraglaciecola aestuariivivens]
MDQIELANKQVVVVGMGLTGQSAARFLLAKQAKVIAMDSRLELSTDLAVDLRLGEFDAQVLCQADLIVLSPGVDLAQPAIQQALQAGVKVIGDIELFALFNSVPVIAITGSNGKSTVTQLVTNMCLQAGKKALLGGNIGVPALDLLGQDADILVLELSSFQLETTASLHTLAATVLNISEDHLDRHGSLARYQQIKLGIYTHCQHPVCNRDDQMASPSNLVPLISYGLSASEQGFAFDAKQGIILFNSQPYLASQDCLLVGAHNMLNIQAAAALAKVAGIDDASIVQAAKVFAGLPHRCQTVLLSNHIRWINDSKATNVGATLAAIHGLTTDADHRLILIAGGEGKGADFSVLKASFNRSVALLITLGKDGHKIAQLHSNSIPVSSMQEAVKVAVQHSQPGDIVLLSPACASFDMFDNYQHRGDCFAHAVKELAA